MNVKPLNIEGLLLVELSVHGDERGFFTERFKRSVFTELGLPTNFVQDNHSRSAPGVLRGLHYQVLPSQGKLVGVTRGKIWDVAVNSDYTSVIDEDLDGNRHIKVLPEDLILESVVKVEVDED